MSGHVDGVGTVAAFAPVGGRTPTAAGGSRSTRPRRWRRFIAAKGSIAVDGVSLTVNAVEAARFPVNLIPHTLAVTTLRDLAVGRAGSTSRSTCVARYVARLPRIRALNERARGGAPPRERGGDMDLTTLERLPLWIGGTRGRADDDALRRGDQSGDRRSDPPRAATPTRPTSTPPCAPPRTRFPAWARAPALRRARMLMRFRELLETHKKDLARIVTEEHGKTLVDAEGSVTRGIEVVEFATGIPHLLKGEYSDNVGHRRRQLVAAACRWACARASRRSTFRRWCRCGCFRWRSPAATPSC